MGCNVFYDKAKTYESEKDDPASDNDMLDSAGIGKDFCPGHIWINQTTEQAYICIKANEKAALWKRIT